MKRFLSFLALTVLVVASCSKYDDTELRNKVNGYESRIAALEALSSYKDLLGKLSAGKTVTGFSQSGNEITLTFSDNTTVKFNQQGPKGDPGESIKGDPGDPGQDGVTPQFKIEGETWKVSYDDGATWSDAGSAIDRSLIKDIKLSADGKTLNITLADGTVVPVAFGEKEKFGIVVGAGRKGFSMLENIESIRACHVVVPYTLTGEIENVDDASVAVVNIQAYKDPWNGNCAIPVMLAEVEPTSPKTGNIVINMDRARYDEELNYGWIDDPGQIWYTYPTLKVDVVAFFPDGTSAHNSFYCTGVRFTCDDEYVNWYYDHYCPCLEVDSNGEVLPIWIRHYMLDSELYDGPELPILPLKDIYIISELGSISMTTTYVDGKPFAWYGESGIEYKMIYDIKANTTSSQRTKEIYCSKKITDTSGGGFFHFQLIQPKN